MVGVLLTGLKDYHEITGDERTASMIVRGAKNIIKETWVPEKNGMRYTSCPETGAGTGLSTLVTEGILYGYGLSGDSELGEVALAGTLQAAGNASGFGKSFSQQIRATPHFLHQLYQLRATETALQLEAGEAAVALISNAEAKPFEVTVRPWPGAREGVARLIAPDETLVAEVQLNPFTPAVAIGPGEVPMAGIYRLELAGRGPWSVDSYLTPLVIDAARKVTFAPRPRRLTYFIAPQAEARPGAPPLPLNNQDVGGFYGAPLERAKDLLLAVVEKDKEFQFFLSGSTVVAPWSQFWFDPRQPTAEPRIQGNLGPGGSGEVVLDATGSSDLGGPIVRADWYLDGNPIGEGMKLKYRLPEEGVHTIRLRVVDASGLTGTASLTVRIPPAWVREADAGRAVVIEAEDFSEEIGGEVRLYERVATSGKMLTQWHASIGHTLKWNVTVPATGDYIIALKYCTDSTGTMRDFKVDGSHPLPGLAEFHLPRTGGFATSRDDWRYIRLGEWTGEPFRIRLTQGHHDISMTNLGDGCALDQIMILPAP